LGLFKFIAAYWVGILIAMSSAIGLWIWLKKKKQAARKQYLLDKYINADLVERLLNGELWIGMTTGQLEDSIGEPDAIDRKELKTKVKETWKYQEIQRGQYRLRIDIEDGEVVGKTKRSA
jgi:hypothetical protein